MNATIGAFEQVALSAITASVMNPRKFFDDAAMADLTASVRGAGVQSPILLRPTFDPDDGDLVRYQIVCGERRFRAATAAGLATIPAIVREMGDEEAYQAQIIENLQREGLSPMEEAESYAQLANNGISTVDIAAKVGKPGPYVHQRLQLLKLVDKGQKALVNGKLPLGHAIEVAKLTSAQQPAALDYALESWRNVKLSDLKEFIQREFRLQLSKAPFSIKADNLHPEAVACVNCTKRTAADTLLFSDVREGDSCLDAKCYGVKVQTVIHVRVEDLKKSQEKVPLLSSHYSLPKGSPAGTIGSASYQQIYSKKDSCENAIYGVLVDGDKIGQKLKICIDPKCKTHRSGGNRFGGPGMAGDQEARRKAKAKERREGEIRVRMAKAIVNQIHSSNLSDEDVNIEDAIDLADYAFHRMDHAQDGRLAAVLGWPKTWMGYQSKDRRDALAGMGTRKALALAVLATVASDLTVAHTWGPSRPDHLKQIADRHDVDVPTITAAVDAELKAKIKPAKKVVAKKATRAKGKKAERKKLSPEARKRIAAAMKKRWAKKGGD
jgi:ParB/RepB/Spo0J family partition protein